MRRSTEHSIGHKQGIASFQFQKFMQLTNLGTFNSNRIYVVELQWRNNTCIFIWTNWTEREEKGGKGGERERETTG
ncbi:hypothetical protein ACN38_g12344 [Penicillium nordicum]|uniref:Uncharacterized protein n=1 Tax=Penicillium nordicum TaxID=229535 RepID=A0A0M8NYQ1_9EURO|nr:hypothetical protein ACN38_g12344 [Penicillium nordicum]